LIYLIFNKNIELFFRNILNPYDRLVMLDAFCDEFTNYENRVKVKCLPNTIIKYWFNLADFISFLTVERWLFENNFNFVFHAVA